MIIPIRKFGGMVTNPLQEDIPDFASAWNQNVDPVPKGQLRGIADSGDSYTANGTAIPDATESAWINYQLSGVEKRDLVYVDKEDNDITIIEDFYAAQASRTFTDKVTAPVGTLSTAETFNNAVQIGAGSGKTDIPYVVYRLTEDRKFVENNSTASAGLYAHYGRCINPDLVFAVNTITQTTPMTVNFRRVYVAGVKNHGMLDGDRIEIRGVVNPTGANGIWSVTVVSDTVVSLDGSTSGAAYDSGGVVYGDTAGIATLTYNDAAGYFQPNIKYAYGISVVYDGIQESNLRTYYDSQLSATSSTATGDTITLALKLNAFRSGYSMFSDPLFDKRITAVKIYRAESSDANPENLGLYRLVRTIDINKGQGEVDWDSTGAMSYVDSGGYPGGGQTYEEETGILESIQRPYVHYNLNTVGGGYHWMAQAYVPNVYTAVADGAPTPADWDRYIFRSKKFRPNMVNWAEDWMTLPEIPIDMKFYNNKLYAFTENVVYRINPELLIIEDDFQGAGVSKKGGIVATEYGLFFCNLNGAYRLFNDKITTISDNIKITTNTTKTNESWEAFATDALSDPGTIGRIIAGYLSDKRCVLFIGQAPAASTTLAFAYYLPTEEWFIWTFGAELLDANSGLITGKDGELYWSGTTTLNKLLGGSSNEDFDWLSKEFTLGEPSQNKSWKKIIWNGTTSAGSNTIAVKYGVDGTYPATTATSDTYFNIYNKTFQVLLDCAGTSKVDSLDVLVRKLAGDR